MKSRRLIALCAVLIGTLVASTAISQNAPPTQPAGAATGTWSWIQRGTFGRSGRPGGPAAPASQPANLPPNSRVVTAKFIQDGETLLGKVENYGPAIKDVDQGAIKNGVITFQIVQILNPATAARINRPQYEVLATYKGQLEGDTIRGSTWRGPEGTGQPETWVATRQKE